MKERVPMKFAAIVAPPGIMLLAALLLFHEILITGRCLYGSDFVLQFYPWKKFVFDHLHSQGSLPFWNPYLFSGSPLIANIQVAMFYPLGFLYYLLPPDIAYGYSTVLHIELGSFFMYLFMRSLELDRAASFFSATVFMFNGYFMGHLYAGHLSFVQNYVWIPLILLLLNAFVVKGSLHCAAAAGLCLGFQILGGFPQIAFYTLLASSLFVLLGGAYAVGAERRMRPLRLGGGWLLFVLLGFSLAAVQVLPTYELTTLSTRGGGVSYEMATYESLHPKEILAFLLPDIFGNPVDGTYWRSREFWHFWESCGYVGIFPLFLLFVGGRGKTSARVRAFAVTLILLALFLALGKYNPMYPLIYHLPGFSSFRLPAQIIFLYVFGVALLSGIGFSRLLKGEWEFTRGFWVFSALAGLVLVCAVMGLTFFRLEFFYSLFRNFSEGPVTHANLSLLYERISHTVYKSCLIFFLSFFLLVLAKRGRISASLFSFLACALVLVDLYLFVAPLVKSYEFVTPPEKQRLLSQLSRTPEKGRVVTSDPGFKTNDGLRYGFPSIQGYDPLILRKYADYVLTSQGYPPDDHVVNLYEVPAPQVKLIALLNTRQLVSGGEVRDLENGIPYAFLAPKGTVKPEQSILPFMKSDEFEPRRMVVFSKKPNQGLLMGDPNRPFVGSCEVLSHRAGEIRFRVSCNQPCYLVMSEIWYPGWVALTDGKEREVLCGNSIFRVVPVEEGNHEVTLFFVSWPFRVGGLISLVTVLGCACLLLLDRRSAVDTQG
jgi:hypothetical protein